MTLLYNVHKRNQNLIWINIGFKTVERIGNVQINKNCRFRQLIRPFDMTMKSICIKSKH